MGQFEAISVGKKVHLHTGALGEFIVDVHDVILIGPGDNPDTVTLAYEGMDMVTSKIIGVQIWPGSVITTQGDVIYPYEQLHARLTRGLQESDLTQQMYDFAVSTAARAFASNWEYIIGSSARSRLKRLLPERYV